MNRYTKVWGGDDKMKKSGRNLEVFLGVLIFLSFIILCPGLSRAADVILSEDFEDNVLDSRIHIETVGDITNPSSGIKDITEFGSTKAFGFGKSTCGADCWDANITKLIIQFPTPTYVSYISFKEIELYGNWGSGGKVFIDGDPLIINGRQVSETFGRLPYNDYIADTTYRTQTLLINKTISTIEIQSWDITNVSEIFIDDLQIFGADHPIGVICQVIHNSDYDPDPGSLNNLITEIINRTGNNEIFYGGFVALDSVPACNMLYITGHYYPFSFTETQRANLLSYLQNGGLLFADDCSNYLDNEGFETSFRAEIQNILGQNLEILPTDHPVFSSFYHLSGTLPTAWNNEPLEGIDLENRTAVIYSDNDYGCAWEGDSSCDSSCRENSFEMGINVALYKLNSDQVFYPNIAVSPTWRNFGDIAVDSCSEPQVFSISNTGNAYLHVSSITLCDEVDYVLGGTGNILTDCPIDSLFGIYLEPGEACTFSVTFCPKSPGTHDAYLTLSSNDPDASGYVPLAGTGINPNWDYPVLPYYPGSYAPRSFFYQNDHLGEDEALSEGTPIYSIGEGKVVFYDKAPGYGELVAVVEHDLGREYDFTNAYGTLVKTRYILSIYGHLRKCADREGTLDCTYLRKGYSVTKDTVVGYVNNSSHPDDLKKDPNGDGLEHLHMGIRLSDLKTAQKRDSKWFRGYEKETTFGSDFGAASEVILILRTQ
jgi:hypothetical protein